MRREKKMIMVSFSFLLFYLFREFCFAIFLFRFVFIRIIKFDAFCLQLLILKHRGSHLTFA